MGEKTAKKLLADYGGDIEHIFAHIDELPPRDQRLLRGKEEEARKSKYLATIVCDVPVQLDLAACRVGQVNQERAVALFRELEFRTLVDKIPGVSSARETSGEPEASEPVEELDEDLLTAPPLGVVQIMEPPPPPDTEEPGTLVEMAAQEARSTNLVATAQIEPGADSTPTGPAQLSLFEMPEPTGEVVRKLRLPAVGQSGIAETPLFFMDKEDPKKTSTLVVNTPEMLRVLVSSLRGSGAFAMDTESTSEDPWQAELVGLSFAMAPGEAYYIPVGHTRTLEGEEDGHAASENRCARRAQTRP